MKKIIYISLFVILLLNIPLANAKSLAFPEDSGLYITLNGGCVIPLGFFKEPTNTYPGMGVCAMNGYGVNFQIEHPFKLPINLGSLGLTLKASYYANKYDLQKFEDLSSNDLGGYVVSGGSLFYKENSYMGGIFFETGFKRMSFKIKEMIGLDFVSLPYVDYSLPPGRGTIWPILPEPFLSYSTPSSINDFVYSIEFSIQYAFMKHLSIRGNIEYLNNFSYSTSGQEIGLGYFPVSQMHLEIGLSYHFL